MKNLKKIVSVLMCAVMLFTTLVAFGSAANKCTCGNDPIVQIYGKQPLYLFNEDGTRKPIPESIDIGKVAGEVLPLIKEAIKTDDWSAYCDALYDIIAPLYADAKMDGNGFPVKANTGVDFAWSPSTMKTAHTYHFGETFDYAFDWRLSPLDVADDINRFVESVKQKTGHDKVVLVSRCMGTNFAAAYLYKYERPRGYSNITSIAMLDGGMNGMDWAEALFSGNVVLDPDSVYRFIQKEDYIGSFVEDEAVAELVNLTINSLKETLGFAGACKYLEKVFYPKIKDDLIARVVREFYGTSGGSLSMANDYFEQSINTIFPTDEYKAEYAGVIAKATEMHDNVTAKVGEILKEAESKGVTVGIFAEYGDQAIPIFEKSAYCGDKTVTLYDQSFGATTSKVDSTLSKSYIKTRVDAGLGKYISADKQVDASTCLFPDTTWFFKNALHEYPDAIYSVICDFVRGATPNVHSNPNYPQFMNYNRNFDAFPDCKELSPLQEKNVNDMDWDSYRMPAGEATGTLVETIGKVFLDFFNMIMSFVRRITDMASIFG